MKIGEVDQAIKKQKQSLPKESWGCKVGSEQVWKGKVVILYKVELFRYISGYGDRDDHVFLHRINMLRPKTYSCIIDIVDGRYKRIA